MDLSVNVIGGGLAGAEASWQLASRGISVKLYDMKPNKHSPAHKNNGLAELVCSNSFRSDDAINNAVELLDKYVDDYGSYTCKDSNCASIARAAIDTSIINKMGHHFWF